MTEFVGTRYIRRGTPASGQYCADCAERKRAEEAEQALHVAKAIADRPAPQSTTGSLCPACGMWASGDALFCGYCRFQFGSATDATELQPATGQRLIAGLIDCILLFGVFTVMAFALSGTEQSEISRTVRVGLRNEEYLVYLGIVYLYYVVFELLTSASLGKLVMGLKVVKVSGQPYDLGAILVRNVIRFIDSIPLGLYLVGLISIAVTEKKQRLGDLAVGTTVVKSR